MRFAMCMMWYVHSDILFSESIADSPQSWGTKGSDKVSDDLGVVKSSGDNKDEVTVDLPIEQKDINAVYAAELQILGTKAPKEVRVISDDQKQEDYYKNVRTNVSFSFLKNPKRKILMLRTGVAGLDNDQRGPGGCDSVGTFLAKFPII